MRSFVLLLALLSLGTAAPAVETARIPLTHILPSRVTQMLADPKAAFLETGAAEKTSPASLIPSGVESIAPNDPQKLLIVRGTAQGIAEVKGILRLIDIAARPVRMTVRLIRFRKDAMGAVTKDSLSEIEAGSFNNEPVRVPIQVDGQSFSAMIQPRINGDNSVTVYSQLRRLSLGTGEGTVAETYRRVRSGESARLAGIMVASDPNLQKALDPPIIEPDGPAVPSELGPGISVYYLEVVPTAAPRKAAK